MKFKKISDFGRVLPGEGVLPIELFINYFKYKGSSTIEVFRSGNINLLMKRLKIHYWW